MIAYNPKEWFSLILKFHKADTVRKLGPIMLILGSLTAAVVVSDVYLFQLDASSQVAKVSVMYSLLGFVISLLLVFRTNTAYERWWEGRKLWGGLVNCSRNLAIKLESFLAEHPTEMSYFRPLLIHFPYALKNHLRNVSSMNESELADLFHIKELKDRKHLPLHISTLLYQKLAGLERQGILSSEQIIVINNDAQQWMEICGACERIKNTPIPFSYSAFLKKFIFIYVTTLPFTYAPVLGWYSVPIVMFIFYVLASLEIIAEEIENPFGTDANDLPLDEIAKTIRQSIETVAKSSNHIKLGGSTVNES
jgi:ion channel-forming bestrophin family protein